MVEDRKKRDITFDMMKGIGILLMLIGHVWAAYIPHIFIRLFILFTCRYF